MTELSYREEAIKLSDEIYRLDYYTDLWYNIVQNFDFETATEYEICDILNKFWFALPDSPAIRRDPFFKLCDLSERIFDEDLYNGD